MEKPNLEVMPENYNMNKVDRLNLDINRQSKTNNIR